MFCIVSGSRNPASSTRRCSMFARHAASPAHVTPDPIRITAGSAALLVNAAAALLLLLPQQRSELPMPIRALDPPTHVVPIQQTIIPTPPPHTPPTPPTPRHEQHKEGKTEEQA